MTKTETQTGQIKFERILDGTPGYCQCIEQKSITLDVSGNTPLVCNGCSLPLKIKENSLEWLER